MPKPKNEQEYEEVLEYEQYLPILIGAGALAAGIFIKI